MRVLIACEFSGVVRDAFREFGHDAWSCDVMPSMEMRFHIQDDAIKVAYGMEWDLMVAHPPCTYLCNSGVRWLFGGKGTMRDQDRWERMEQASRFFMELWNAPIERIAIENPIMHGYAKSRTKPHTQIIQPWQFGHGETKATCLWLKRLDKLQPTQIVEGRKGRVHFASPGPDRWKERSITLPGIAAAMAKQWGVPPS